jgi:hypothetical protein
MVDQLKIYPIWSNFIYFIAAIYSLIIAINAYCIKMKSKTILFTLYSILIMLTGIMSIVYHTNTPSWTNDATVIETQKFKMLLKNDQVFAITLCIISLLFLFYRVYVLKSILPFIFDPSFSLAILFFVLSGIFYGISDHHFKQTSDCSRQKCVNVNLDAYDIFHSNWHIFTSIGIIFWITLINNSY